MEKPLSNFELEVLQIFWDKGQITVREIHTEICEKRQVAYTTVKTIVDRLEKKAAIARVKRYGRTILYEPILDREAVSQPLLRRFVKTVFGDNKKALFANLVSSSTLV